jgi:copper(I)-binding protein
MIVRCAAAVLALLLPAAAMAESVIVSQPWARASIIASRPGAVYLAIESPKADRLTGITTPVANEAMIHAVEEEQDGISRMVHVPALELPAGGRLRLEPGGTHIMLTGLHAKLVEGESFPMTLTFEQAPEATVAVPVLGIAAQRSDEAGQ